MFHVFSNVSSLVRSWRRPGIRNIQGSPRCCQEGFARPGRANHQNITFLDHDLAEFMVGIQKTLVIVAFGMNPLVVIVDGTKFSWRPLAPHNIHREWI